MKTLILTALATLLATYILPGVTVTGIVSALLFSLLLGLVNGSLGKIIKVLGCGITILTFGIFNLVVNGLMVRLAASFIPGVEVSSLMSGILLSIIISIVTTVFGSEDMD